MMDNFDAPLKIQRCASVKNTINDFMATPQYVLITALLAAISNIFSLELPVFTLIAAICVYTVLWGRDLLPITPLIIYGYLSPSGRNNPGQNPASVFSFGHGGCYVVCLAVVIAGAIVYRVIRDRKQFFHKKRVLLSGMLILSAAYLLSGLGSSAYPDALTKNLLFALLQGCAIVIPYWLFSAGVNWKESRTDYLAWIGFCAGGLLLCQIIGIYLTNHVIVNNVIHRELIYTGWGIHNNIGGILAMMIPFAFYLATKYRRGWIGTVVGSAFLLGVLLTCSRSSILVGSVIYCVCIFLMLHYARNRRHNTIALVTVITVVLLIFLLCRKYLLLLFSDLLARKLDPSSRDIIYHEGIALFAQAPVFGSSFYSPGYIPWDWSILDAFSNFFPPRWHNTFIQLLASCGVVGLGAYLFHRVQTIRLFLRRFSKETAFIGCSLAVLLVCSMFDCHFFNIGPTLFYSMALAFAENTLATR